MHGDWLQLHEESHLCDSVHDLFCAGAASGSCQRDAKLVSSLASAFNYASKILSTHSDAERAPLAIISNGGFRTCRPIALAGAGSVANGDHIATLAHTLDAQVPS